MAFATMLDVERLHVLVVVGLKCLSRCYRVTKTIEQRVTKGVQIANRKDLFVAILVVSIFAIILKDAIYLVIDKIFKMIEGGFPPIS